MEQNQKERAGGLGFGENGEDLNELWTLVNNNISVLVY